MVKADGFIYINGLGNVKALGFTQSQLEDIIYKKLIEIGEDKRFELNIVEFNSKTITVVSDVGPTTSVPYVQLPCIWRVY